jgi:hypothetical protein
MIDITMYRDEGPVISGRGTPIEVVNFNMKNSGVYLVEYYPTKETSSASLVRPVDAGAQDLSYPVYTFFKITGDGEKVKNLHIQISMETAGEADGVQVFYALASDYAEPTDSYQGNMIWLVKQDGTVMSPEVWPCLSVGGPHLAFTRQPSYTLTAGIPLYTNYLVTQTRVNKGSSVGNSAEVKLKFIVQEFE